MFIYCMRKSTPVNIPTELRRQIKEYIESDQTFLSIDEFVRAAIRKFLELKKMQKSEDLKKLIEDMKKIKKEVRQE